MCPRENCPPVEKTDHTLLVEFRSNNSKNLIQSVLTCKGTSYDLSVVGYPLYCVVSDNVGMGGFAWLFWSADVSHVCFTWDEGEV